jgi:threonine 3-dehydrogenase
MKALVKLKPEPGLVLQEIPRPTLEDHEVLIKIQTTAICGTDLHIYEWNTWAQHTIRVPIVIGHEFMGEIVEVGRDVHHLKIGDRVSGEGHITCGFCRNCREEKQHLCPHTQGIGVNRNGAFCEFFAFPASNIIPLPEYISNETAAILDPLGNAIHTTLSFDLIGEDVLITGAGPVGLMAIAIAKQVGARYIVITDINDYRLDLAKKLGATYAINIQKESLAKAIQTLNLTDGFTVGLEMSGQAEAMRLLLDSVSYGASIGLLGIPDRDFEIDWNKIIFKGLTLKGIYGRKMYETWDKMLHLLQSGLNIAPIITHHFKIEEFEKAFDNARSGQTGKIILQWDAQ